MVLFEHSSLERQLNLKLESAKVLTSYQNIKAMPKLEIKKQIEISTISYDQIIGNIKFISNIYINLFLT